jgi:LssY C-terminus
VFHKSSFLAYSVLLLLVPVSAEELSVATALEVRLSSATGSRISHAGDPIEATIIAPVSVQGRIIVPQGSRLLGSIADATAIGFGLKHSTASIAYAFRKLQLPSGEAIPVNTKLVEVETAKENVDGLGTVHGIHPVASLSSSVSFYAVPLLLVDPAIGAPVLAMKTLVAPSPDPEIYFPAGTELILRLTTAVEVPAPNTNSVPTGSFSGGELTDIEHLLKTSAQRAYMGNHPSDVVNVLFIGSHEQMDRAFHASGWSQAQRKSPMSLYWMYHALTRRTGYHSAPMNALTLNGVPSAFVHQKSLNTVQKRHHVRVWRYPGRANIWLGTAAEDVGFRFRLAHWTHSTDPNVDSERAKVVNDLVFTGCVGAAGLLPGAPMHLLQDPKAEHSIVTDGDVAAIRLTDCLHPRLMAGVGNTSGLHKGGKLARTLTAFRDDLVRSNIFFTTYNTLMSLAKRKSEPITTHAPPINSHTGRLDWLSSAHSLEGRPGR